MFGNDTTQRYIKSAVSYAQVGPGKTVNMTVAADGISANGIAIAFDSGEGAPLPDGLIIGVGKTTSGNIVIPLVNGSATTANASNVGLRIIVLEPRGEEKRL